MQDPDNGRPVRKELFDLWIDRVTEDLHSVKNEQKEQRDKLNAVYYRTLVLSGAIVGGDRTIGWLLSGVKAPSAVAEMISDATSWALMALRMI